MVSAICARGTGVGADGIVFLEHSSAATVRMVYLNADGSRADLCGNATLCTARLAVELGMSSAPELSIETDSGIVQARSANGGFEIDLPPVIEVRPADEEIATEGGEQRVGYACVGVPHVVVRCDDVGVVDVPNRGKPIRWHPSLARGANANFVSLGAADAGWDIRTYERGVEGETLACGSGAVASAILLTEWGDAPAGSPIELHTRSGRTLRVRLSRQSGGWRASLGGEARVVFQARLSEI